jgi:hypothetical protein
MIISFKNFTSSVCICCVVSVCVCLFCICHCILMTNPNMTREIVIKRPNIQVRRSNLLFISERKSSNRLSTDSNRLFISERKSSSRLSSFFCPSSNLESFSTISLSDMRGATSMARPAVEHRKINTDMVKTLNKYFPIFIIYPVIKTLSRFSSKNGDSALLSNVSFCFDAGALVKILYINERKAVINVIRNV